MADICYDKAILVTGMHRSGTSALSRVLMLLGGDPPAELLVPSVNNARGFWESPKVNAVNNELLAKRGTNWHSIMPIASAKADQEDRAAIIKCVRSQFADATRPIIKDPRVCRLADTWIDALGSISGKLLFPMIVRNPAEVAASLAARNSLSPVSAALLWARYCLDAEQATREMSRGIISYAGLIDDWETAVDHLQSQIGSELLSRSDNAAAITEFLSPSLHQQQASSAETDAFVAPYPLIRDSWELMQSWVEKGRLGTQELAALDALRADLNRIASVADDVLEKNRILEKRLVHLKRHNRTADTSIEGEGQASQLMADLRKEIQTSLQAVNDTVGDLLRKSHKRTSVFMQDARTALDTRRYSDARQLEDLRQILEQLNAQRTGDRATIAGMLDKIEQLRDQREALDLERGELVRLNKSLQHELAQAAEQRESSAAELSASEAEAARLYLQLEERDARVSDLEAESRVLQEERDALQSRAALSEAQEAALASEAADLAKGNVELARELAEAEAVRVELKEVIRKYRSTQATLNRTKAGLELARSRLTESQELASKQAAEIARFKAQWHYRVVTMLVAVFDRWFHRKRTARMAMRRHAAIVERSGLFDASWYLNRYPDVAATGMDALRHYLQSGWRENRDPGPAFSVSRYLRSNPDVAEAGFEPLLHYIEFGQAEGRGTSASKLAQFVAAANRATAAAAPVYKPEAPPAGSIAPTPAQPANTLPSDYSDLRTAVAHDAVLAVTLDQFEQFSGHASYMAETWEHVPAAAPSQLVDAWFINDLTLRLRRGGSGGSLAICQSLPGEKRIEILAGTVSTDREIVDIRLRSAYHPLLFVESDGADFSVSFMAFPSLLRGGIHYPEYLSDIARVPRKGRSSAFDLALRYARQLAELRINGYAPLVARLAVNVAGATGTSHTFAPSFRAWLGEVFCLSICAHPGYNDSYLTRSLLPDVPAQQPGGIMVMPADMIPMIGVLCVAQEHDEKVVDGHALLGLSHAVATNDDSQPGLVVLTPPLPLRMPRHALLPPYSGQIGLNSGIMPRKQVGPAALLRQRTFKRHEAELLFPVSPALPLTSHEVSGLRLFIEVGGAVESLVLRTLDALAMQECASTLHVAFVADEPVSGAILERATTLFGARISVDPNCLIAVESASEPLSGFLRPGLVLHDGRTLKVLADMVESGAATASCPLIRSVRAGKGWAVQIIANGLVSERPVDAYTKAQVETSNTMLGATYPVREPLAGVWLAETQKLRNWIVNDVHRLKRSDGEHWCVANTTASVADGWNSAPVSFEPPIADPSVHCSVRILKG